MPDPIFDSALLSMCMTWRHDFGLLDRKEQMEVKRELLGLYEHHVKPALDRAEAAESELSALRQRVEEQKNLLGSISYVLTNGVISKPASIEDYREWAQELVMDAKDRADAAVARAERAEGALREIRQIVIGSAWPSVSRGSVSEQIVGIVAATLAPAQDAKPDNVPTAPRNKEWGKPRWGQE